MATYDLTQVTPNKLKTGDIINVPYSGTYKTITLPKGIYKLEVWGAQGGSYSSTYYGGKGGYSYGTLTLEDDETILYCYAGQQKSGWGTSAGATSGTAFNGGGYGTTVYYSGTYTYTCAGGGGSDIRIGSTSLYARVIVAGGGSGSTNGCTGYYGGGTTSGGYSSTYQATQTKAGNLGSFGTGANYIPSSTNYKYAGAGGGGGWYGGGANTTRSDSDTNVRKYHGGGSGYVYTASTASNYPSGCLLNSAYYLTDAATIAGNASFVDSSGSTVTGHSGNGYVRITVIKAGSQFKVKTGDSLTVLPYIESTGTQYIDTGFGSTKGWRVEAEVALMSTGNGTVTGCIYSSGSTYWRQYVAIVSGAWSLGHYSNGSSGSTITVGTKYNIEANTTSGNGYLIIDGSKNVDYTTTFSEHPAYNVYIFANNMGGATDNASMRLYSYKLYNENNTLVRDFIPVLDSKGVACLFDKVEQKLYYNQGTGVFYYVKPAELPEGYIQVEYIQSNGTQYIDVGFKPNQDTRVMMDVYTPTQSSYPTALFGGRNGDTSRSDSYTVWLISATQFQTDFDTEAVKPNIVPVGRFFVDKNKITTTINGETYTNTSATFQSNYNLALLTQIDVGGADVRMTEGNLYSAKVYDNDILIRDFVPCKNTSGTVGLYDLVENKFYTNAGTDNFIAGSVVDDVVENKIINFETWVDGQDLKVKASAPYTKLSYIEATGTQYIDTEHQWQSNNVKVEMQYAYTAIGTNSLFGSETSTPQYGICAYHLNTTDLAFWVGSSQQLLSQTVTTNLKYNLTTHANNGTFTMNLNNVTSSTTYSGSVQNGRSLFIFCNNIQSGVSQYSKIKLYSFKMYDNNVLVRDYIPVLDKNGVACLYDKVTGKMFYNKGTGNFAYKRFDYTPVEYIQSTGTQWIDTNWYPSSAEIGELKFVIDATFGTAGSGGWAVSGIGSSGYFFHTGLNSNRQIVYGSGTDDVSTGVAYTDKRVVAELDYKAKTMKWTEVDSGKVLVNQSITVNTPTASVGKFYLFAYATVASAVAVPYTGVIYSFKGYKNNVLIHDIIPVIDADGTVCMFDKVTHQFLYNSGTGNFTTKYYPNEELEYLSSDGNSYIDTGFVPNQNTRIDIVTMPLSVDDASANTGFIPYGSATAHNNNAFECYSQSSQYEFNFCTSYSFVGTAKIGELITISHDKNNVTVISDGKSETLTLTNGTFTAPYTLTLFGTHRSSMLCGKQRIYSCQIYDNENLVRDYIPKTDANGTPCMYDKITDKYYYNSGSGTLNGIAKNGHIELPIQHATWATVKQLYKKVIEDLVVLDYIESTGTQYIDTGFKPSSNTSIDIDIEMTNSGKANAFYGSRTATKSNSFILFAKSDGTGFNFYYGTTSTVVNSPTGTIIGRFSIQQNANVVTINGVSSTLPAENFTGTQNMFLFAANTAGAFDTQTDINRIRMCKIYDNGTLVRDYIPVLDASGVACLYDKVTNQLFYNQGTGAFIAGYKTEFEPETELAFLASTGTQYIDTGFKPNQDTRIVMKAQLTSSTTEAGAFLFGARTSSNSSDTFSFLWYTSKNAFRSDYANSQPTLDTSIGMFDMLYLDHNKNVVRLNNTYCEHTYTSFSSPVNLTLFCVNTNGTKSMYTSMRLYGMEIYDNENLVRDYIPKTDSQGVPALYDKVSNTYYYNQGTGNFGAVSKTNKIQHVYWKQVI